MATKIISVSIDEDVIDKADKIVKDHVDVANRSHLVSILILKEYARRSKKKGS